jgi:hypothetical protein
MIEETVLRDLVGAKIFSVNIFVKIHNAQKVFFLNCFNVVDRKKTGIF